MRRAVNGTGTAGWIYKRAIERGNLLVAETTRRTEVPRPTLGELFELRGSSH
jgi:hypothetical protein